MFSVLQTRYLFECPQFLLLILIPFSSRLLSLRVVCLESSPLTSPRRLIFGFSAHVSSIGGHNMGHVPCLPLLGPLKHIILIWSYTFIDRTDIHSVSAIFFHQTSCSRVAGTMLNFVHYCVFSFSRELIT